MKKLLILVPVVVLFAVSLIASAKGPVPKTTGDVDFWTPWGTVNLVFNAHESDPAKGNLYWSRGAPFANWWSGHVFYTDVIDDDDAEFKVRVTDGAPVVVGCDITFHVHDGGEPGFGVDSVNVTAVVHTPGETCAALGQTQGPWFINGGNLQVHN